MSMTVKKSFPGGILILLLILLALLSVVLSAGYFYYITRTRTAEIVKETLSTLTTLVDSQATLAEISYANRDYNRLKKLFMERTAINGILESFFVLSNGKIVIHSNEETVKNLQGNIASDEFAYNLDQILMPLRRKKREVLFLDYHIINQKVPYGLRERALLKRYIYHGVDRVGWLATRAVFYRSKPVGTVNYIITKKRIYDLINATALESLYILGVLLGCTLLISLTTSVIIYRKYRRVVTEQPVENPHVPELQPDQTAEDGIESLSPPEISVPDTRTVPLVVPGRIKDAIPVTK